MDDQQRLRDLLVTVPPMHKRFVELGSLELAAGSLALTDLAAGQDARLVRSAAVTTLASSLDHLVAWAAIFVRARIFPSYAQYTLLRSAAESGAMARWLVDPTVEARVRVGRGISYAAADLDERRKFEELPWPSGAPRPPRSSRWQPARARVADLLRNAAADGIVPPKINRTALVETFGPSEAAYRVLSSYAHAGQAMPFAAGDRGSVSEVDVGGLYTVRAGASMSGTAMVTEAVIHFTRLALAEVFAYHGHDATPGPPAE